MTPSARIAASIELLEAILASWLQPGRIPADKLIDNYFKARRYLGSHDRGAVAERVYWIIRHKASLDWWAVRQGVEPTARALVMESMLFRKEVNAQQLGLLFDGGKYAPTPLTEREREFAQQVSPPMASPAMPDWVRLNFPQWMEEHLHASLGTAMEKEMLAMQEQAAVDLRANTLRVSRDSLLAKLKAEGFEGAPSRLAPYGIRLSKRGAVFASPLFKQGLFEMQDEGSQAVAYLVQAEPGQRVIDFCAGAGGKTLAIAAMMKNKGRLLAWDTSAKRLAQLPIRLKRAGVSNTEWRVISSASDSHIKRHKQTADRVLVDVPCSGSGTWRRNPDLKWRFNAKDLEETLALQKNILESASRLVKPGGRLVYATCSLLHCENAAQIDDFLKTRSNFRVVCAEKIWNKTTSDAAGKVSYLSLTPHQDGVDGFFAAVLERISA